jgi:hypothetical protein
MTNKPRSPLFWIVLVLGGGVASCCFFSLTILGLGALSDDAPSASGPSSPSTGEGGQWQVAVEVARGASLSQPLPGGRWVAQYGSNVDHVVARAGPTTWVQTNTSGSIYELTFDEDGEYSWLWSAGLTMNGARFESNCTERGTWSLSGNQLELTPTSQAAQYKNSSGTQEKTDEDLSVRRYEVLDLTLETLDSKQRFAGMKMTGPKPVWSTDSGSLSMTMQRLAD